MDIKEIRNILKKSRQQKRENYGTYIKAIVDYPNILLPVKTYGDMDRTWEKLKDVAVARNCSIVTAKQLKIKKRR